MRVSIFARALALTVLLAGQASADGKCEPEALASKYPTLVGKTIRVAQSGEGAPFTFRDPEDFDKLIGLDADLVRASFACIGVPFEFRTGALVGALAVGHRRPGRSDVEQPLLHPDAGRAGPC